MNLPPPIHKFPSSTNKLGSTIRWTQIRIYSRTWVRKIRLLRRHYGRRQVIYEERPIEVPELIHVEAVTQVPRGGARGDGGQGAPASRLRPGGFGVSCFYVFLFLLFLFFLFCVFFLFSFFLFRLFFFSVSRRTKWLGEALKVMKGRRFQAGKKRVDARRSPYPNEIPSGFSENKPHFEEE